MLAEARLSYLWTSLDGYMAKTKQPQNNILCLKTPVVLVVDPTMAKLTSLGCGTHEPGHCNGGFHLVLQHSDSAVLQLHFQLIQHIL